MASTDPILMSLIRAIASGDVQVATRMLKESPSLAGTSLEDGATRQAPKAHYLEDIEHYVYAGDTALHVAGAAYQRKLAEKLVSLGAEVRAKNRRGAEPLHYAADGMPGSRTWNPQAQATTIAWLIEAGADPDAADKGGVTPLHRAVRTRCAAAVRALLDGGANARRKNKNGSTPLQLAMITTGRGGTGGLEAKTEQAEILRLLKQHTGK